MRPLFCGMIRPRRVPHRRYWTGAASEPACAGVHSLVRDPIDQTDGEFLRSHFDYRTNDELWSVFQDAFREPTQPPHATPELLAKLRADHAARKAAGTPEPPVIIYGGIPGTGL
jgi:hypothetical protein